jgi:hypothetical protein
MLTLSNLASAESGGAKREVNMKLLTARISLAFRVRVAATVRRLRELAWVAGISIVASDLVARASERS